MRQLIIYMKVDSVPPFSTKQGDVSAVDDHNVVAAVVERVVDGLVLALQDVGDLLGRVERVLPLGIVQKPLTRKSGPLLDPLEP